MSLYAITLTAGLSLEQYQAVLSAWKGPDPKPVRKPKPKR